MLINQLQLTSPHLGQWQGLVDVVTQSKPLWQTFLPGQKSEAQKQKESAQRRVGRAKAIVDSIPTFARFPELGNRLYSYLAACMPGPTPACSADTLANYIALNFPFEVAEDIMRLNPAIMEKKRGYSFITEWQRLLKPKMSFMKRLTSTTISQPSRPMDETLPRLPPIYLPPTPTPTPTPTLPPISLPPIFLPPAPPLPPISLPPIVLPPIQETFPVPPVPIFRVRRNLLKNVCPCLKNRFNGGPDSLKNRRFMLYSILR